MESSGCARQVIRFGPFEADLASGQLRKNGLKIRVQELPFRILTLVVERPGEVVTREELQQKLWPDGTFVEFEHSLNTAVNKLRTALGDDADVPRFIETIPRRGYRFIGSVEPLPTEAAAVEPASPRTPRKLPLALVLGALLAVSAAVNVLFWIRQPEAGDQGRVRRFALATEEEVLDAEISPDGRRVAYVTGPPNSIWIQELDRSLPRRIAGPEDGLFFVAWEPSGEAVAAGYPDRVVKISVAGGVPVLICRSPKHFRTRRGDWSPDGARILFNPIPPGKVFEVAAHGGEPRQIDLFRGDEKEEHLCPRYLPSPAGRRRIVFQERFAGRIVALDLDSRQREVLAEGERPFYSRTGHVLYEASRSLRALPFSPETMRPAGEPFVVELDASRASVSADGTLVYIGVGSQSQQLVWRGRDGKESGEIGQPQERMSIPVLSPDGNRVAVVAQEEGRDFDVWVHDAARGLKTRVTFAPGRKDRPLWHPDGIRITFSSMHAGNPDVYLQRADGSGKPELLLGTPYYEHGYCWSSDGRYLLFNRDQGQYKDIWYLRFKDDGTAEETPFVKTEFDELSPSLSADSRYIAWESNKSGRYEVYVRPFPTGDGEWQVSTNGGRQPRWRKDGRELFYVEPEDTLMAAPITVAPSFSAGAPRELFQEATLQGRGHRYDVTPDGQRFVVVKTINRAEPVIRVVQNWLSEFRDRKKK